MTIIGALNRAEFEANYMQFFGKHPSAEVENFFEAVAYILLLEKELRANGMSIESIVPLAK